LVYKIKAERTLEGHSHGYTGRDDGMRTSAPCPTATALSCCAIFGNATNSETNMPLPAYLGWGSLTGYKKGDISLEDIALSSHHKILELITFNLLIISVSCRRWRCAFPGGE
jgi:hypothetical protein